MLTWNMVMAHPDRLTSVLNKLSGDGWTIFQVSFNDLNRMYTIIMNRGI